MLISIAHAVPPGAEVKPSLPPSAHWYAAMLDHVDYGMLLVRNDGSLIHMNCVARDALNDEHALFADHQRIAARRADDAQRLADALAGAARGLRRLLTLGGPACSGSVAVIPLPATDGAAESVTLLVLGKRRVCEDLSVQMFARTHDLTPGEVDVLAALCSGDKPSAIAHRRGVALSTVRSQVANIRLKTRAGSVAALVRQVWALPPIVPALRGMMARAIAPTHAPANASMRSMAA
jgi:DNA-binding CsgD family transcriptional regulator